MMRLLFSLLIFLVVTACVTSQNNESQTKSKLVHVVLIWLKQPGNIEHRERIINVSQGLKEIPTVQKISVGQPVTSNRKIVDDSFDVGLTMTFKSIEDMQRYLAHPMHRNAVEDVLKPLAAEIKVYDFSNTM